MVLMGNHGMDYTCPHGRLRIILPNSVQKSSVKFFMISLLGKNEPFLLFCMHNGTLYTLLWPCMSRSSAIICLHIAVLTRSEPGCGEYNLYLCRLITRLSGWKESY